MSKKQLAEEIYEKSGLAAGYGKRKIIPSKDAWVASLLKNNTKQELIDMYECLCCTC